jgi:hypothetical protein
MSDKYASDWFYEEADKRHGPCSLKQLRQLVASGEVKPTTLVFTVGMGCWKEAGQVGELRANPCPPAASNGIRQFLVALGKVLNTPLTAPTPAAPTSSAPSLVSCAVCAKPVATSAAACPHCGAPPEREKTQASLGGSHGNHRSILLVLGIALSVAGAMYGVHRYYGPPSTGPGIDSLQTQTRDKMNEAYVAGRIPERIESVHLVRETDSKYVGYAETERGRRIGLTVMGGDANWIWKTDPFFLEP